MGVTAFFYAATGDMNSVESALRTVWPDELGRLVAEARTEGRALASIYRNRDGIVLALWQDGEYTVFAESELCLFDADPLARLSALTGTVIAVVIGDHGGTYALEVHRAGGLVRSLDNEAEPLGEALPQEEGVDLSGFCDSQIEQIWSAFGLTHYYEGIAPFRVYSEAGADSGG